MSDKLTVGFCGLRGYVKINLKKYPFSCKMKYINQEGWYKQT